MATAQIDTGEDLPEMFVKREISDTKMRHLLEGSPSKYEALKNSTGYPVKSYTFSAEALHSLIGQINQPSGIRIYFARYSNCESSLPGLREGKLILLFAPERSLRNPPDTHYYLNNDGYDNEIYQVKSTCARTWIKQFDDEDQVKLRETIDPDDEDNKDDDVPEGFSDTKSIFYTNSQIDGAFVKENRIAHKRGDFQYITSAYRVSLSDYGPEGAGNPEGPFYRNRLFIQFDYMFESNKRKEVFYLDDMDGFYLRKPKPNPEHKNIFGLDNGQLCPTHCPKP